MRAMDVKRIFVDTNVLIYSTNVSSPWLSTAEKALEKAEKHNIELIVSQQILREYLAGATRISSLGDSVTLQEIIENIQKFQMEFTVVRESSEVLTHLIELIQEIPTAGKQVHDANIVATMLVHSIDYLLTHNVDDFKRFSGRIHILPLEEWAKAIEEPESMEKKEQ
jgi:predicted nucleic acid-binding protein